MKLTLRALRTEYGLTQAQEAKMIGCSAYTIYNIETGRHKPSVSTLNKIARLYHADLNKITLKTRLDRK